MPWDVRNEPVGFGIMIGPICPCWGMNWWLWENERICGCIGGAPAYGII